MFIRQAVQADFDRLLAHILRDPIGWIDEHIYRRYVVSGNYRANRMWLAEDSAGNIVASAIWWGASSDEHPHTLDCLYVSTAVADRVAVGAALLQAGHAAFLLRGMQNVPEYHLFLTPGSRGDSAVCEEVEWRRAAAQSAGLTNELERLRYEWTPGCGLEQSTGRLLFSPEPDDSVFLEAFRRVAVKSLDQETRRSLARFGIEGHARETLECYSRMRGQRDWWRIASTENGTLVGFAIPSANEDNPVIGYLGVVPELRGHGYAGDLLAEATRILAAQGAERIRADTDTKNLPMATTFESARYKNFGVRLVFSGPDPIQWTK